LCPFLLLSSRANPFCTCYLFHGFPLELFNGFLRKLTTLFHHVDISPVFRV
jgi:hypothetical protein